MNNEIQFDPSKPVQARDGRKAGIYSTGNGGDYPIHGWYEVDGRRYVRQWRVDGCISKDIKTAFDLINIPEYPPRPEVEGGRLEYRGTHWDNGGKACCYAVYNKRSDQWVVHNCDYIPLGEPYHYAEFIPDEPTTVRGWLETIEDDGLRARALELMEDGKKKRVTFFGAIHAAFPWSKTEEGYDFWFGVSKGEITKLPKRIPYTLETFPDEFVMMRPKGKIFRWAIGSTCSMGVTPANGTLREWDELKDYEFSSGDGIWHPAGQEVTNE